MNSYKGNGLGSEWFLESVTLANRVRGVWRTWKGKKRKEVRLPLGWQLPIYAA